MHLSESAKKLRATGTKLLNRLYERNCYREFMQPEHWLAPQWAINSIESALDASLAQRLTNPNESVALLAEHHMRVLHNIPFSLPFPLRVRVLRNLIHQDRCNILDGPQDWVRARVRRARVLPDSFEELNRLGSNLKRTIQIEFVNHEGLVEAGIDGGGLFKEFINALAGQSFNPEYGLFKCTEQALLFPNPQAESANPYAETIHHLQLFEFIGRMIGKAIYDGILIELRLAPFFLRKMLGKEMYFDDLESLDRDLYKNLMWTKKYDGDYSDLALTFEVTENVLGETISSELIPGGKDMPVTANNVVQYKALISDYWLTRRIAHQSHALMRGLGDLIRPDWIRMFSPDELQMLVSGSTQPVDLKDLRSNCVYTGGYHDSHPSVEIFWRVVDGFDRKQREDLLMFVTSCSRPPLLGFRELHPSFCIQKTSHNSEEADSRLPTASTCMNLLKLPCYNSVEACRERLLYAISAGAGFELS